MFNSISHCLVERRWVPHKLHEAMMRDRPIHGIALTADWMISGALVTIGALSLAAILWGGMPPAAQYALVVTGGGLTIWSSIMTVKALQNRYGHVPPRHSLKIGVSHV